MKKVAVIDYGMSNLGSVKRAIEECGADCTIAVSPTDLSEKSHVILPGVGSFTDGMNSLRERGWEEAIHEYAVNKNVPLLGICLGMQLLLERGFEGGETRGLGLIQGSVEKLVPIDSKERLPHVGWNEIHPVMESSLIKHIQYGSDFYFVHSYHVTTQEPYVLARTPYCGGFVSCVQHNLIFGVQFHPEKSQRNGRKLLKNFLEI